MKNTGNVILLIQNLNRSIVNININDIIFLVKIEVYKKGDIYGEFFRGRTFKDTKR